MIIGNIDYINLLPFFIFLKKYLKKSSERAALHFYKGVPAKINRAFVKGRVEGAMISSIVSRRYRCSDFGIIANKEVLSVLVCEGEKRGDPESNTSNVLAKILDVDGEVIIGDKALKARKTRHCKDLATLWYERYHLPFVFARFCYRRDDKEFQKLADNFLKKRIKIPYHYLKKYAKRSSLSIKEVREYLTLIGYTIGPKERRSLHLFFKEAKKIKRG